MVRIGTWLRVFAAALVLLGSVSPAGAVSLWSTSAIGTGTGGSVTVNGLTITASYCTVTVGGTAFTATQGGCQQLGLQFNAVSGSAQPQIEITGAANALSGTVTVNGSKYNPIFSTASTVTGANGTVYHENAGTDSLVVYFTITDASGSTAKVNNIASSLTGSDTGTYKSATEANDISLASTYSSANPAENGSIPTLKIGSVSGYAGTASSSLALPSATGSFSVNNTIAISTGYNTGDTLVLSNVNQIFTLKTPEPASIALVLVGLGGLLAVRRRSSR